MSITKRYNKYDLGLVVREGLKIKFSADKAKSIKDKLIRKEKEK